MNVPKNERRDWSLVIFIIPLGILLIILVGQLAISIFPNWSVNANMRSNLDPNASGQPVSILQPLLPQIMTPMAWAESYLEQGSDFTFPPFFFFEPTATASSSPTTVSPSPTAPSPTATTPSPTTTYTSTPNPTDDDNNPTPSPVSGCTDPSALNYDSSATVDDGSCTFPTPVSGCTDSAALNYDPFATVDDGSCTYPPPAGYPSTIDPSYGTPAAPDPDIGIGDPDDNIGYLDDGTYLVINLSVEVGLTPDANYDLVYYEHDFNNLGYVNFDWVIIGISHFPDGSEYFEVFNWFNGIPDDNSNVGDIAGTEDDDQPIPVSELYDPDGAGPAPQTGILIDVDTATSEPPPGTYNYIVIISPNVPSDGSGNEAEIDAIDIVEVPIPP